MASGRCEVEEMSHVQDHYKMVKYVEQACGDCLIRIEAWRPFKGDHGFMDVQIISNSASAYHMHLRTRIRNAWKALRGSYDWSGFEVYDSDEADALLTALALASGEAFPTIISETVVKKT